jgi:hypothetical protein
MNNAEQTAAENLKAAWSDLIKAKKVYNIRRTAENAAALAVAHSNFENARAACAK